MSAKEMFNALDYEEVEGLFTCTYISRKDDSCYVTFNQMSLTYLPEIEHEGGLNVNVALHMAITQKMKELRWIK